MPRPVVSSKYSRPSVPGGTSLSSSSTTMARNGGTARPTDPGCSQPLRARDGARRADLGGAVGVLQHRPEPLDHLSLDVDRARRAGVGHEPQRAHVVVAAAPRRAAPAAGRSASAPSPWSRPDARRSPGARCSASKRPRTTTGMPAARTRTPDSGPVWYIGPTTRWVPKAANGLRPRRGHVLAHRAAAGEHRRRELDALGPAGRARTCTSGWAAARRRLTARAADDAASQSSHDRAPCSTVEPPPDDDRHAGARRRFDAVAAVSGPTNSDARARSRSRM